MAREKLSSVSTSGFIHDTFLKSLEESLISLQTDYTDIMLFHDGSTSEWLYHEASEASFPLAVKWILDQPYIHGSAVAMANFKQLDDHLSMMGQQHG